MPIGALNDDSFRLYMELSKLLLLRMTVAVIIVVAGIYTDFNLCVKTRVYFSGRVKAVRWELKRRSGRFAQRVMCGTGMACIWNHSTSQ